MKSLIKISWSICHCVAEKFISSQLLPSSLDHRGKRLTNAFYLLFRHTCMWSLGKELVEELARRGKKLKKKSFIAKRHQAWSTKNIVHNFFRILNTHTHTHNHALELCRKRVLQRIYEMRCRRKSVEIFRFADLNSTSAVSWGRKEVDMKGRERLNARREVG